MANVIMGDPFGMAKLHRKHGLPPLQCLNMAFFLHAQDYGVLRRAQVYSDDIPCFLDEERIIGNLKSPLPVGLKTERLPDPTDNLQ